MPSTEIAAERAHAKRSPSSYKYVKACPGYIPQKNDILHPNTIRGTKIHEAIETGKYDDLDDQELRWLEYCLAEKQKIIAEIFGSNPYEEFKEIKVEVSARYKSWGFVDSILVSGAVGIMLDWKFGWGEVDDAEENEQGKGYAVAIYKKFPCLTS